MKLARVRWSGTGRELCTLTRCNEILTFRQRLVKTSRVKLLIYHDAYKDVQ